MNPKKKLRTCGWCGNPGHNQTKCVQKLTQTSERLMRNPGPHFKKLDGTDYCSCKFVNTSFGIYGVSVTIPETCHNCNEWCCKLARPNSEFEFECSNHGTYVEQFLNNTIGT